jgi:hypothetical protein
MPKKKYTATIHFDNEAAAKHFLSWLSNSGEQDYWQSMEEHEDVSLIPYDSDYDCDKLEAEFECVVVKKA